MDDWRENIGLSAFGVSDEGSDGDGAKLIFDASPSVVTLVSGIGLLEKRTADDWRDRLGRAGVVVPSRSGRKVSSLDGLIWRDRLALVGRSLVLSGASDGNASSSLFILPASAVLGADRGSTLRCDDAP
jgi:hypothetical protein